MELRLVLKVEKGKDGKLKASLASPDQGAGNIPLSSIGLKDGTLTFESKVIGAKFSGKTMKSGEGFDGQFTQGGLKLPLVLKKTDKVSVAPRPQMPKPPFPYRIRGRRLREQGRRRQAGRHADPAAGTGVRSHPCSC